MEDTNKSALSAEMLKLRAQMDDIQALKAKKLREQKRVAETFHQKLAGHVPHSFLALHTTYVFLQEGLIENTRLTVKNLEAAVVASQRPGYFRYFEPSDDIKKIENGKELAHLQNLLYNVEKEIQAVRARLLHFEFI